MLDTSKTWLYPPEVQHNQSKSNLVQRGSLHLVRIGLYVKFFSAVLQFKWLFFSIISNILQMCYVLKCVDFVQRDLLNTDDQNHNIITAFSLSMWISSADCRPTIKKKMFIALFGLTWNMHLKLRDDFKTQPPVDRLFRPVPVPTGFYCSKQWQPPGSGQNRRSTGGWVLKSPLTVFITR